MYSPEYTVVRVRVSVDEDQTKRALQKARPHLGRPTRRRDTPTPSIPSQARPSYYIIPQNQSACRGRAKILMLKFSAKAPFPYRLYRNSVVVTAQEHKATVEQA